MIMLGTLRVSEPFVFFCFLNFVFALFCCMRMGAWRGRRRKRERRAGRLWRKDKKSVTRGGGRKETKEDRSWGKSQEEKM